MDHVADTPRTGLKLLNPLLAAALSAGLLCVTPAIAEESSRWVGPHGHFSIDLSTQGWGVVDRTGFAEFYDGELMIASPNADPRTDSRCSVEVLSQAAPNAPSRALMNEGTRRLANRPAITEQHEEFRLDRIEVAEIDGVATLDVYGRFMSLDTVTRRFFLHHGGEVLMYTFSCSVAASNDSAVAGAHAIAASLRFAE
jgi:hypothetical protein